MQLNIILDSWTISIFILIQFYKVIKMLISEMQVKFLSVIFKNGISYYSYLYEIMANTVYIEYTNFIIYGGKRLCYLRLTMKERTVILFVILS